MTLRTKSAKNEFAQANHGREKSEKSSLLKDSWISPVQADEFTRVLSMLETS
eukprot:COSAG02_NODE_31980_length_524_cov_0.830588_1_plen_51_part_10